MLSGTPSIRWQIQETALNRGATLMNAEVREQQIDKLAMWMIANDDKLKESLLNGIESYLKNENSKLENRLRVSLFKQNKFANVNKLKIKIEQACDILDLADAIKQSIQLDVKGANSLTTSLLNAIFFGYPDHVNENFLSSGLVLSEILNRINLCYIPMQDKSAGNAPVV